MSQPLPRLIKSRPWWRRWLLGLVASLVLLAIGAAVRYAYNHHQVMTRLQAALDQLDRDDPGWRVEEIEAARAEVPEAENGARVVVAAASRLPKGWADRPPAVKLEELAPNELLAPAQVGALNKDEEALREALAVARTLADRPAGRHRIEYKRVTIGTLLKDQVEVRKVVRLLAEDAVRHAQANDPRAALRSCRAALNAARSLGDEPLIISQLIRVGGALTAARTIERVLAQGPQPPAEELARLQALLADEATRPAMLIGLRGERAMMHGMFDALESGDFSTSILVDGNAPPNWMERLRGPIIRDRIRAEHPLYLQLITDRVEAARMPPHTQAPGERDFIEEKAGLPDTAIITRLLLPAVEKVGLAMRRNQARLGCLQVALAAERYRLQHEGNWPASAADLVPAFLPAVPLDPFDGRPLRYRRLKEGVVIYSVGPDEKDDGGLSLDLSHSPKELSASGTDVGVRLWDVSARRRPPHPGPLEK